MILGPKISPKIVIFGHNFETTFWRTFGLILEPFWGSIFVPDRPWRRHVGPQRAKESSNEAKTRHASRIVFYKYFGLKSSPKTAPRGPRWRSRGSKRAPRNEKKQSQKGSRFLYLFGGVLGHKNCSKTLSKLGQRKSKKVVPWRWSTKKKQKQIPQRPALRPWLYHPEPQELTTVTRFESLLTSWKPRIGDSYTF